MKSIGLLHDPEMSPEQRALIAEKRAAYEARVKKNDAVKARAPASTAAAFSRADYGRRRRRIGVATANLRKPPSAFPPGATMCGKCNTNAVDPDGWVCDVFELRVFEVRVRTREAASPIMPIRSRRAVAIALLACGVCVFAATPVESRAADEAGQPAVVKVASVKVIDAGTTQGDARAAFELVNRRSRRVLCDGAVRRRHGDGRRRLRGRAGVRYRRCGAREARGRLSEVQNRRSRRARDALGVVPRRALPTLC